MSTTKDIIKGLLKGVADNKISLFGGLITACLFPILVTYAILENFHILDHPKLSFIMYGALTWVFILGHFMVFIGLFVVRSKKGSPLFYATQFKEHLAEPKKFGSMHKVILLVTFITLVNIFVISVSAYNGFHYSESVDFCARLCHGVMAPEFTAYQNSPHSRVGCVKCHIGSGATWFMKSKLSGIRQLFAVVWDTYSKPIETPIHGLRPARETCEQCHRPELFHGDRLRVLDKFLEDEQNTHVRTVLLMKVGSGDYRGLKPQGSHWHVAGSRNIIYQHSDRERTRIKDVIMIDENGVETLYAVNSQETNEVETSEGGGIREMDCLDCHNRPTHIYLYPDEALDLKLMTGEIPRELPYIKKLGRDLIEKDYTSQQEARKVIAQELLSWYALNYPELVAEKPSQLDKAITGVSLAYCENVFPKMNIGYGTYERNIGHRNEGGCFRCHDDSHQSLVGGTISQSCDLCHLIIAEEEPVDDLARTIEDALDDIQPVLKAPE
jgi:hypothetical protein